MELIPGNIYRIKRTDEFCHAYNLKGVVSLDFGRYYNAIFVGNIKLEVGGRNIFISHNKVTTYYMFGTENIDYIYTKEDELRDEVSSLETKLQQLKEELRRLINQ